MPSYCVSTILNSEQRDIATAIWYSLGMQGCEEENVDGGVRVKVYFKDKDMAQQALKDLECRSPLSPVLFFQVEEEDWNKKWRESMEPAKLAPGYWVSPLWLPPPMKDEDIWIKIEPKMAFGTGHHETTRLAAREILSKRKWLSGKKILDIGTGSGVLCFVADHCKTSSCIGVEIDQDCRENLAENHLINSPEGKINFIIGTLPCLKDSISFDMIVMNMIMKESEPLLPRVFELLNPEGIVVWSGILLQEKEDAINSAADFNLKLLQEKSEHEWWCGSFKKNPEAPLISVL